MIFKGLTAYSFRIDLSNNEQSTAEIVKFFEKYNVVKYYGNPELGEETEKQHYQMIIWMSDRQSKELVKMRNYWRGKVKVKKGGGVSLKKARDEKKLFGYCRKEEKNDIFTNVSKEIYLKIKKYETLIALKVQKREKLKKIIGGISQKLSEKEYLVELERAYFSVYGKPCMRRNYYYENLRIAKYMNSSDIIEATFNGFSPHCTGIHSDMITKVNYGYGYDDHEPANQQNLEYLYEKIKFNEKELKNEIVM